MKILFAHNRWYTTSEEEIMTYSKCMVRELRALGHDVIEAPKQRFKNDDQYKRFDLLIDVDCGRDKYGDYDWHLTDFVPIPSVLFLIDTHGKPELHQALSRHADHVFFAVWNKRDLFSDHASAHWCPNFTDDAFIDKARKHDPEVDFGFFGSRKGLTRADPMIQIAKKLGYEPYVAEVAKKNQHRWPMTANQMYKCRVLFNHGQKHDDPNLRVMESMLVGRALITPNDLESGIGHLFEPWQDYIPYEPYTYDGLEDRMRWAMNRPDACAKIAENANKKVLRNHLTKHRIKQIMDVVGG